MSSKTLRMNERERKGKIKGKLKYKSALRFLLQRVYKINIILESNKKIIRTSISKIITTGIVNY